MGRPQWAAVSPAGCPKLRSLGVQIFVLESFREFVGCRRAGSVGVHDSRDARSSALGPPWVSSTPSRELLQWVSTKPVHQPRRWTAASRAARHASLGVHQPLHPPTVSVGVHQPRGATRCPRTSSAKSAVPSGFSRQGRGCPQTRLGDEARGGRRRSANQWVSTIGSGGCPELELGPSLSQRKPNRWCAFGDGSLPPAFVAQGREALV